MYIYSWANFISSEGGWHSAEKKIIEYYFFERGSVSPKIERFLNDK